MTFDPTDELTGVGRLAPPDDLQVDIHLGHKRVSSIQLQPDQKDESARTLPLARQIKRLG